MIKEKKGRFVMTYPKVDTIELYKLINMLIAQKIPFEVHEHMGTPHIEYPSSNHCICSVICHWGSFGHEEGLLEIMGLLTKEESECDGVVGWLTANEVFERISTDYYINPKEKEYLVRV